MRARNDPGPHGGYGWNAQRPDYRDRIFSPTATARTSPDATDLQSFQSIPYLDQGQQGSCTGFGTVNGVMYNQAVQGESVVEPSPAFVYFNARRAEGTTSQDSGAQVRDAVGGVVKYGVASNSEFPYSDQTYDIAPSDQVYADATKQEALVYEAVRYGHLRLTIASGFPVIFGITVFESFESQEVAQTGIVPMPSAGEQNIGGHCIIMFGYNDSTKVTSAGQTPVRHIRCRNSWGPDWGCGGDFFLPYSYFRYLASDYWVIRKIGDNQ